MCQNLVMNPNEHKHLPVGVDSGGVEEEERQECLKLLVCGQICIQKVC
jgi:hypothetical protein